MRRRKVICPDPMVIKPGSSDSDPPSPFITLQPVTFITSLNHHCLEHPFPLPFEGLTGTQLSISTSKTLPKLSPILAWLSSCVALIANTPNIYPHLGAYQYCIIIIFAYLASLMADQCLVHLSLPTSQKGFE